MIEAKTLALIEAEHFPNICDTKNLMMIHELFFLNNIILITFVYLIFITPYVTDEVNSHIN